VGTHRLDFAEFYRTAAPLPSAPWIRPTPHERILIVNTAPGVARFPRHPSLPVVLIIRPAALGAHAGLEIFSGFEPGVPANSRVQPVVGTALVHLSPECTG